MDFIILACYAAFFTLLTWNNFRCGVLMSIIFLPAYLLRFNLGPVPSTVLELNIAIIALTWLVRYSRTDLPHLISAFKKYRLLLIFSVLFLIAGFIATLTNPLLLKALGLWRAYFLEPIILFFIITARQIEYKYLRDALAFSAVSIALLAIIQKIFGGPFPPSLWDDQLSGRPTSFFTTPNAIGLFLAPVTLLLSDSIMRLIKKTRQPGDYWRAAVFLLCVVAILISFSQGAWAALTGGLLLFIFLAGKKRLTVFIVVIIALSSMLIPNIRSAFLFSDQAGQNRLTLWQYSIDYLSASPTHFVLGSGMRMFFNEVQRPHYNVKEMERLIYPHNIFLNFWLESGLLGMITFFGVFICLVVAGVRLLAHDRLRGAIILGALAAFFIHGLVDVPYFKNDLAMLFWIIAALTIASSDKQ